MPGRPRRPLVLILSSFVAADPVGGGAQAALLARLGVDSVLAPTLLLGRHPGRGAPGGGPVDGATFAGLLQGIAATGVLSRCDAVIAGYFASAGQVSEAARTIGAVRTANPRAWIVVDPVMGDAPTGLYVPEPVARAIAADLVPLADLIAPNAWELARLTGMPAGDPAAALSAARTLARPVLVSSVDSGERIGALLALENEAWLTSHVRDPGDPKGAGDALTAAYVGAILKGAPPHRALAIATRTAVRIALGTARPVTLTWLE